MAFISNMECSMSRATILTLSLVAFALSSGALAQGVVRAAVAVEQAVRAAHLGPEATQAAR
jgi:hypothetical protein